MNAPTLAAWLAATAMLLAAVPPAAARDAVRRLPQQSIAFDDLAPRGMVLQQCWNATGLDRRGRVYVGFTSRRADNREDFALFRYDPVTGDRRFLGTFMDASAAAGNLAAGEEIPKGHTRLLEVDGRIYTASQGFHDFKDAIDALPRFRGSHLYAYDIGTGTLADVHARAAGRRADTTQRHHCAGGGAREHPARRIGASHKQHNPFQPQERPGSSQAFHGGSAIR